MRKTIVLPRQLPRAKWVFRRRCGAVASVGCVLALAVSCRAPTETEISPSSTASQPQAATTPDHWGWDYNLEHRCVCSPFPGKANFYKDVGDCPVDPGSGLPPHHWTVAVQAEVSLGNSITGPQSQSLPINQGGGLTLDWKPHVDESGRPNYWVNLKTDFYHHPHPGGAMVFTWYALMDHADHGGGPLPPPNDLAFSAVMKFDNSVPDGSSTRVFAGFAGTWNNHTWSIELVLQTTNWGSDHPDPDIIHVITYPNGDVYMVMDGRPLGYQLPFGKETRIEIPWSKLIQSLIDRGFFQAPARGWKNRAAATRTVFVGTEVKNFRKEKSVMADLWVTDFRIETP